MKMIMNMDIPPEHKIWAVVLAIEEAAAIAGIGAELEIDPKALTKYLKDAEIRQILLRLESQDKVIKIHYLPGRDLVISLDLGLDQSTIRLSIPDDPAFRAFYDKIHFLFFGSLEKLTAENFLALHDVTQDIQEELEMTPANQVTIPIKREIIRHQLLYPAHSANMMDRYCDLRMKAIRYLKEHGHISEYELHRDNWDSIITVTVDRLDFTRFYKRLVEIYPKKVSSEKKRTPSSEQPISEEDEKLLISSKNRQAQIEALKRMLEEQEKEEKIASAVATKVSKKLEESGVLPKKFLGLPRATGWEKVTMQFIDGENVRILGPDNFVQEASYKEMGFQNNKSVPRKPNAQWAFLKILSENSGLLTWSDRQAHSSLKKAKQLLSDGLRNYFGIASDPFHPYHKEKSYHIRMTLIPEGTGGEVPMQRREDAPDPLGIQEELDRLHE